MFKCSITTNALQLFWAGKPDKIWQKQNDYILLEGWMSTFCVCVKMLQMKQAREKKSVNNSGYVFLIHALCSQAQSSQRTEISKWRYEDFI